ncbi:MAG TPA: type II toxin-antitoxin system HicB family antitoxin [Bacteroidales bacterium]|nr:type II toxin-antitoxin system HicB family antitoxin [Bacteroidales bacterium]HSA44823.1 type II toxin-antitoxin system HicB family antitoxin [Bacteroidales bacterium]
MKQIELTAVFEPCAEGGFIAFIQELPGINSQGETLEEAKENLADAINLMFEERRNIQTKDKKREINNLITQTLSFSF